MSMLGDILSAVREGLFWLVVTASIGTVFEALIPGEKHTWKSRARGFGFWLAYTAVGALTIIPLQILYQRAAIKPLFPIDLSQSTVSRNPLIMVLGYTIFPLAATVISDLFYYWFHRAQHTFRSLWNFHSVHHSIEELNAFNDWHHISEEIIKVPLMIIPMGLLTSVSVPQVMVITFVLRVVTAMIHANTKVRYGPVKYLVAEPRYHRIHHSVEKQHFDKNFAAFFPVWDIIFGTAYFPRAEEYPKTGLKDQREPRSLREYVMAPFKKSLGIRKSVMHTVCKPTTPK